MALRPIVQTVSKLAYLFVDSEYNQSITRFLVWYRIRILWPWGHHLSRNVLAVMAYTFWYSVCCQDMLRYDTG